MDAITDLTYYESTAIVSVAHEDLILVNLTTGKTLKLPGLKGVHSTDIDWATKRIFAAHPNNNTVSDFLT